MTEPTNNTVNDDAFDALVTLAPEGVTRLLDLWRMRTVNGRVEHVETEGSRRTWTLWENGTQTGHVRGRNRAAGDYAPDMHEASWTWEAAGSGRAALGLPPLPVAESTQGPAGESTDPAGDTVRVTATITSTESKWEVTHVDTGIALAGPPTTDALSTPTPTADAPTVDAPTEEAGDEP